GEHDAAVWTKRRYRSAEISKLLANAGLSARRVGYRNSLLFPAAVITRLWKRGRTARDGAHSDVRPVPTPINALLSGILALERRLPLALPFGLSVFVVGERKAAVARDTMRGSPPAEAERRIL
ncbi:MAG TPA: hypothetical protein VK392_00520, partial [Thermoanaerobaculia bacterium]|nr:hypothetical protein [Thermoanaerobaculia bacterium]